MAKKSTKTKVPAGTKSNFLSKLIPRSSKAKLLVFLIVFALIGGGIMAYRSFAATGAGVYGADQIISSFASNSLITENNGIKKGTRVWRLNDKGSAIEIGPKPVIWAPYIKVCANVYTSESNARLELIVTNGAHKNNSTQSVNSSGYYQKLCSPELHHLSQFANQPIKGVARNMSPHGADIKVASMSLEYRN